MGIEIMCVRMSTTAHKGFLLSGTWVVLNKYTMYEINSANASRLPTTMKAIKNFICCLSTSGSEGGGITSLKNVAMNHTIMTIGKIVNRPQSIASGLDMAAIFAT